MELRTTASSVLTQLTDVIEQINEKDYSRKVDSLNASIGQHIRHIVEFYLCLFDGIESGKVNYDERKRDKRIEEDKAFTLEVIDGLKKMISKNKNNPVLLLEVKYGDMGNENIPLNTNFERELAYNIEHTIHHLAIIKNAFGEVCEYVVLPENFGVASSTIRYRNQ